MTKRALLLAGCAALTAVPAGAAVSDFRLPGSETPTPSPTVVGPVDPERPVPRPTPTPTPRATPVPTPTPAPVLTLPPAASQAQPTPTPRATRTVASPTPAPAAAATAVAEPVGEPTAADTATMPAFTAPPPSAPAEPRPEDEGGLPWPWLAGFGVLLALLAGGWVFLRRRMMPGGTVLIVPEIEKPRVPAREPEAPAEPSPAPPGEPLPAAAAAQPATPSSPLHIVVEPLKLTQTVMNATLAYRLNLTNKGEAPLTGLTVAADLVAAHASLPREALTAGPETVLPERHRIESLEPGATAELKGELRLPLAQAMPIRQGQAVVFVPLARFRTATDGDEPRCFTVVVGQPSARGALQPVRLDLGPRSTEGLTGHAF